MSMNVPTFVPPVLAVGQTDRDNGRQGLTSGLHTHKGLFDANSLRATGILMPQSGRGVEVIYNLNPDPGQGSLQCYDRDNSSWLDLNIFGKNINIASQSGGKVTLPAGTAQNLIGEYFAAPAWSLPQTNAWLETPLQVTGPFSGKRTRFDWRVTLNVTALCTVFSGIGIDGTIQWTLGLHTFQANEYATLCGTMYTAPSAATHRIGVFLNANINGVSLTTSAYQILAVTEQVA